MAIFGEFFWNSLAIFWRILCEFLGIFFSEFHQNSLEILWEFFENSWGILGDFFGISLEFLWDFFGYSLGILMEFYWNSLGMYVWEVLNMTLNDAFFSLLRRNRTTNQILRSALARSHLINCLYFIFSGCLL